MGRVQCRSRVYARSTLAEVGMMVREGALEMKARVLAIGFLAGALVPLFWGVLGFLMFNVREGLGSRIFWDAVYLTCPFWVINGNKALVLMPLLNGLTYALLLLVIARLFRQKSQS
jgi:hypothetical protein